MVDWYVLSPAEAINKLNSSKSGLSQKQFELHLSKYGQNEFKAKKEESIVEVFARQFISPIIFLLIAAATISFILGDILESQVILLILLINASVGTYHEHHAQSALKALKNLQSHNVNVLRDSKEISIDAKLLVPGDIVVLRAGDKIAADGRIIESATLAIDESILTGESKPVRKISEALSGNKQLADRTNMAYASTFVTSGRGIMLITSTAQDTEIGKIYSGVSTKAELFPLQIKINNFSSKLGKITIVSIAVFLFLFGVILGPDFGYGFETVLELSLAQAVSFIPAGLPIVITIALAIGVSQMAKQNAITRKLQAIETIGRVDVLCVDKTGTLTINKMTVSHMVISNEEYSVIASNLIYSKNSKEIPALDILGVKDLLESSILCNDSSFSSSGPIGDPVEIALAKYAADFSMDKSHYDSIYPRVSEVQFTPENKFMITAHKDSKKYSLHLKGAPEIVLKSCTHILFDGKVRKLTQKDSISLLKTTASMAKRGLRVLAFAQKTNQKNPKDFFGKYVFLGLIGFMDPLRPEVNATIQKAEQAGVRVVMITGDHKLTAQTIATQAGIISSSADSVLEGSQIDELSVSQLAKIIDKVRVFARVTGEHKSKIVEALRKNGHIVAMTGDGVNDAIALKAAHVGVSLGSGTDVAKESADIVLTDDHMANIVDAIEEGRHSAINIKKVLKYLFATNITEVLFIFLLILSPLWAGSALPLALLPIHILFVNLVTDGLLDVSLATEPKTRKLMSLKPRFFTTELFSKDVIQFIAISATVMGLAMFVTYLFYLTLDLELSHKQTVFFTLLAFFQLWSVQNARSRTQSAFTLGFFSNKYLAGATVLSILIQLFAIYDPTMNQMLKTSPLTPFDWAIIVLVSSSIFIVFEVLKLLQRRGFNILA